MENRFDQLAKDLARGVPRREALRRLGEGLATAMLVSLGLGKAWSQTNNACNGFCSSIFPPGAERKQCLDDAAKGQGLCYECGPAAPPEKQSRFCLEAGPEGGPVCCDPGSVCQGHLCVPNLSACSNPGTCTAPQLCFDSGGVQCTCVSTVDLGPFCLRTDQSCTALKDCVNSSDCAIGEACAVDYCCGRKVCVPPCFN